MSAVTRIARSCRVPSAERDRGAAALEFALLLPVLVTLVFGIIDFGRILNAQVTLSQAARASARLAALGSSTSSVCSEVTANVSGLNISCPSSAVSVVACPSGSDQTTNGSVTITYKYSFTNPLVAVVGSPTITLTGKGVMPCGG